MDADMCDADLPQRGGAPAQACWVPWRRWSPPRPSCRTERCAVLGCVLLALPEWSTDKHQIRREQWKRRTQAEHHPTSTEQRFPGYAALMWPLTSGNTVTPLMQSANNIHHKTNRRHSQSKHTYHSTGSLNPEVESFESHGGSGGRGGRVHRGCSLNDWWSGFDGREGPLYCRWVGHHGDHFWDLQEDIHRPVTPHNRVAQPDHVRRWEHPPEVQQPGAG